MGKFLWIKSGVVICGFVGVEQKMSDRKKEVRAASKQRNSPRFFLYESEQRTKI